MNMEQTTSKLKIKLPSLHKGQIDVAKSNARFKVLSAGRRWGKTRLGVWLCLATAMRGGRAWWVAPTYAMALEGWKDLRVIGVRYGMIVKESEKTLITQTGGMVSVRSADNPDRLRGAGLDFIVLDECAFMKEQTWKEVLRPTLTERQGGALFISTPKGYNWFQRLYEDAENLDDWETWQLPTTTNPFVPISELEIAKKEIGSFLYSQEYEAQFVEATGGIIKPQWFAHYKRIIKQEYDQKGYQINVEYYQLGERLLKADDLSIFTTVDLATSTNENADYTVIMTCGKTEEDDLLVLDVVKQRIEAPDIVPALQNNLQNYQPAFIAIERAGFQLSLIQIAMRSGLPVRELKADKDKVSRALPLSARMEAGKVWFDRQSMWYSNLERELLQFPAGEHDDQVDALAYAVLQSVRQGKYKAY
jgi:predicted phage terminase large subunit-like protein